MDRRDPRLDPRTLVFLQFDFRERPTRPLLLLFSGWKIPVQHSALAALLTCEELESTKEQVNWPKP